MKSLKLFLIVAIMAIISSCSRSNEELIVGTWNEVGTGGSVSIYNADGTYQFNFDDGQTEKGTYRLEGNTLYTLAEDDDEELSEVLTTLNEEKMVANVANTFETSYTRAK
jgi:hypothetical protein